MKVNHFLTIWLLLFSGNSFANCMDTAMMQAAKNNQPENALLQVLSFNGGGK
jgi:hypothetical protein